MAVAARKGERRPGPPGSRCFLVAPDQWGAPEVKLSLRETRHLRQVLRLPVGAIVEITDGQGRRGQAEVVSLGPGAASLRLLSEALPVGESPLALTLALALCRADSFDLVVRQATELGVQRLVPFFAARSLIRPEHWRSSRLERWRRLALETLKSSQRQQAPVVDPPVSLAEAVQGPEPIKIMFWEEVRHRSSAEVVTASEPPTAVRVIIGPEGGLTAAEAQAAQEAGCYLLGLGPRRLRVETAAVAALAIVQHKWGDLSW